MKNRIPDLAVVTGIFAVAAMSASLRAETVALDGVLTEWIESAAEVRTLHFKATGKSVVLSSDMRKIGFPDDEGASETHRPRELEYWFTRDPVRERYWMKDWSMTPKGLLEMESTFVWEAGICRRLIAGSAGGLNEHDDFAIHLQEPENGWETSLTRLLLNRDDSGSNFFERSDFEPISNEELEIGGIVCRAAESRIGSGKRIWFESAHPYRIRRIEIGHLLPQQWGGVEYHLDYDDPFTLTEKVGPIGPSTLQAFLLNGRGGVSIAVRSQFTEFVVNRPLNGNLFRLDPPPGAAAVDYSKTPHESWIQLADGTRRILEGREVLIKNWRHISSQVAGSAMEGKYPLSLPPSAAPGEPMHRPVRWIVVTVNTLLVVALLAFAKRRKSKPPSSPIPGDAK